MRWLLILVFLPSLAWGWDGGQLRGKTSSGYWDVEIDASTHAQTAIDYAHHEAHQKSNFAFSGVTTIGSGVTMAWIFTTADSDKEPHLTFTMTGNAITEVWLYEGTAGVSMSPGSKDVTSLITNDNRRRPLKVSQSEMMEAKGVACDTVGKVILYHNKSGSGTNQSRSGLSATHSGEKILERNTQYAFYFLSGTDSNLINCQLSWYEHTPRE